MDFVVENIKCHGCVNSIKTGLFKIEGVEQVSIDFKPAYRHSTCFRQFVWMEMQILSLSKNH